MPGCAMRGESTSLTPGFFVAPPEATSARWPPVVGVPGTSSA